MGGLLVASAIRSGPCRCRVDGISPWVCLPLVGPMEPEESSYEGRGTLLGCASATAGRGLLGHACLWCAPRNLGRVLLCGMWYAVWLSVCHCRTGPARVCLPLVGAAELQSKMRTVFFFGPACAGAPHQF